MVLVRSIWSFRKKAVQMNRVNSSVPSYSGLFNEDYEIKVSKVFS